MFFHLINYISPTWYFNLHPKKEGLPYLIDVHLLSEEEQRIIAFDSNYSSSYISKLDAAYQAFHKGIIKCDNEHLLALANELPNLKDEYYFIRKYYKSFWAVYILTIRILTWHNPFKEIAAFIKTRKTKKVDLYQSTYKYSEYTNFQSALLQSNPFISVIIPTLNRYNYLEDVLRDLEAQDYMNFEVIIIDQSDPFNEGFYHNRNLNLQVIQQQEKALWLARNMGIKLSKGDYLLFYDDDSRVESDWITQHLKTLDFFRADISSGVSLSVVGAKIPTHYGFFRWGDQIDTGNFLIKKEIFKTTGLFDLQFEGQRMGDGEFGLRCYLQGFKNISNPYAKRIHLKVSEGGLRQMGSWDAFRPKKLLSPRPIPSVNYFIRKYFGNRNAILNLLINVPGSIMPYRFKRSRFLMLWGSFLFVIFSPLFLIPIIRSWHRSSLMLQRGAKIEFFTY
ncbi:MAG: glycosyltransferase family A protein [Bacteroidetes bacterium]|nr:glycosyltransferase family A protein [Bacteroidota bacterium]